MCTGPAKLFGLYPQKGTIAIGSDADIVIFNPNVSRVISHAKQYQNLDYNLYEGTVVQGIHHMCSFARRGNSSRRICYW